MRNFKNIFLALSPIFVIIISLEIYIATIDKSVWNEVEKHADEFVYENSTDGRLHTLKLYDKDSTYVCEVFLSSMTHSASVFNDMNCVASSANRYRSKRAYKYFITKVPEENINTGTKKDETLEHFKQMDKSN